MFEVVTVRLESLRSIREFFSRQYRICRTAATEYTVAQVFWVAKHDVRRTGMFANGTWDSG
jgi:hypothetical protein